MISRTFVEAESATYGYTVDREGCLISYERSEVRVNPNPYLTTTRIGVAAALQSNRDIVKKIKRAKKLEVVINQGYQRI